ncbi:MAG: hypothetical protein GY861_01235 [bacterium]|nr:hypothetical protein [bacterium]
MSNENKTIYEWDVPDDYKIYGRKIRKGMEDIPDKFRVEDCKEANGGIIVYGTYRGREYPNPHLRLLVRHLLQELEILKDNI